MKLTVSPGEMTEADVQTLRDHGHSDAAIHIAAQVIGYFNYINRLADGLNVEAQDWMQPSREEWLSRKANDWPA